MQAILVLVAGFLGAGKTSLILAAARRLESAGIRTGIITNDQGGELVDTALAESEGRLAKEIAGGCFCCRFSDFADAAAYLRESAVAPDVILAEPVGSCMDLVATVVQPFKRYYPDLFRIAPVTVVVDPARAERLLAPDADPLLAYLFRQQIAEADLVVLSKADRYSSLPELPGVAARAVSVQTGAGIAEWLDDVLRADAEATGRAVEIDYALYAGAEARLGWLNWQASVRLKTALSPPMVLGPLLDRVDEILTRDGVEIAHLKAFIRAATGHVKASICANGEEPLVEGILDASPAREHALILNLRAAGDPSALDRAVAQAAAEIPGRVVVTRRECFRPSPPVPQHRFPAGSLSAS